MLLFFSHLIVPRRKYGKLRKVVEAPSKENCSRCRSGKFCPLPGHIGNNIISSKSWKGPELISKRKGKK